MINNFAKSMRQYWMPSLLTLAAFLFASAKANGQTNNFCKEKGFRSVAKMQGNPGEWGNVFSVWGKVNIEKIIDSANGRVVTRVWFPSGTYDPGSMLALGKPVGGAGYAVIFSKKGFECATLRYKVKFSSGFNFVRGGKLPGLAGGLNATYPKLPRGLDGFTARLMWRENGQGEVYAYLRTTPKPGVYYGTSIGRGNWTFSPGVWHVIEESILLNDSDRDDGQLRLMVDNRVVIMEDAMKYRDSSEIRIDGLIFETFFGGNDPSWATSAIVHIDFSDFFLDGYVH